VGLGELGLLAERDRVGGPAGAPAHPGQSDEDGRLAVAEPDLPGDPQGVLEVAFGGGVVRGGGPLDEAEAVQ
jgi:hypothetical protein